MDKCKISVTSEKVWEGESIQCAGKFDFDIRVVWDKRVSRAFDIAGGNSGLIESSRTWRQKGSLQKRISLIWVKNFAPFWVLYRTLALCWTTSKLIAELRKLIITQIICLDVEMLEELHLVFKIEIFVTLQIFQKVCIVYLLCAEHCVECYNKHREIHVKIYSEGKCSTIREGH